MSAPPKTVLRATSEEEEGIRVAVRTADPTTLGPNRMLAGLDHVAAVLDLLADPSVSGPVYSLPHPLTKDAVEVWIAESQASRLRGEGLLILNKDEGGTLSGYSKISVWPQLSSAELGGALRASIQNRGAGGTGAAHTIDWIFRTLNVRLMCLTAALDNIRSAKLIDRLGFKRMGEREVARSDGTLRRSLYWELTRAEWHETDRSSRAHVDTRKLA